MNEYIEKELKKREKLNKKIEKQKNKKQYMYKGITAKNIFCYPFVVLYVESLELYNKYYDFMYSCSDEELTKHLEKYLIQYCLWDEKKGYFWFWCDRDYNLMAWNKVKNPIIKKKLRKASYHRVKKIVEDESFTIPGCTRESERSDYDNRVTGIKFFPEKN